MKCGVITVSDRCSRGEAKDESGPNLARLLEKSPLKPTKVEYLCIPDEKDEIQAILRRFCDDLKLDLVLTTGGTGFSPRDVTPEATKPLLDKETPGLATAMLIESLRVTPSAMLSRPVCGIRKETLIVNLPGSVRGSEECLLFIMPALPHAFDVMHGTPGVHDRSKHLLQGKAEHGSHHRHQHHQHHQHHHHDQHCRHGHHHHHHHHHQEKEKEKQSSDSGSDLSQVALRPRVSQYEMMPMDKAIGCVLENALCPNRKKQLNLNDSLGYILSEDISAADPLPPFRASIKDGYAVVAADGAGDRLVMGPITAGDDAQIVVKSGYVVRISTGAPIPNGADSVVQVEDTELLESADDGRVEVKIRILVAPKVGQDIRPVGCDISVGEKVLCCGERLGPAELGIAATVGISKVNVFKKPAVGVLSTGNELVEPDASLGASQIRDSNRTTLIACIRENGFSPVDLGICVDKRELLVSCIKDAFSKVDVLISTGGVSMGEKDLLKTILQEDLGCVIQFGRVFMKPGKPTTFATVTFNERKKLIFGLPGNPVSATVTFHLFVLPALRKLSGDMHPQQTPIKAQLAADTYLDPRPDYQRAVLQYKEGHDIPHALSTGSQCSSRLLSMRNANALIMLPPKTDASVMLPKGAIVDAILIGRL